MRASMKGKLTIVVQRGLVILTCGVLALGVYRLLSSVISINPPSDDWHSFEPGLFRGWTVGIRNPLDEIRKIEQWI